MKSFPARLASRLFILLITAPTPGRSQGQDQSWQNDPLVAALIKKDYPSAKHLLADGYPVAGRAPVPQAPAYWVIAKDDVQGLRLLIQSGLSVNFDWGKTGGSLLTNAAQFGHLKQVRLLCEAGASVNRESRFGRSPLYTSVTYDHAEVERYLRGRGARYNQWDVVAFHSRGMEPP